jgi:PRC-barrel domain protein
MLRSLGDLKGYAVTATDGDVGGVANFLLDDEHWVIRYLVVEPKGPSGPPRLLISPIFFRQVDWLTQTFHLALTKDKVNNSPNIDADKPVSRQHERDYYGYYDFPYYWGYMSPWGAGAYPALLAAGRRNDKPIEHTDHKTFGDVHLRSASEVRGYHVQGSDEGMGHVDDFIVDDESWEIRYLVVDTKNWWFGKKVLVAPHWANRVSWAERKVFVDLPREVIKNSPEWNPTAGVNREYETRLYDYYGRPAYWFTNDAGMLVFGSGGKPYTVNSSGSGSPGVSASTPDKGR